MNTIWEGILQNAGIRDLMQLGEMKGDCCVLVN